MLLLNDFITDTTKQRLEDLEAQKKTLQEKLVIEQARVEYELTKEDIQNYFRYAMKQCPEMAFDLFIKFVKVYENKIEIGINYAVNAIQNQEPIIQNALLKPAKPKEDLKATQSKP